MKAVLPGQPESRLQTLTTGFWDSTRIIAYISGNAFVILSDHNVLLQTIYGDGDGDEHLQAIAFDEASGKIATCTSTAVQIYQPFGQEEDALKWALQSSFRIEDNNGNSKDAGIPDETIATALSWGADEELLVARDFLALYQTKTTIDCSWKKRLPSPAQFASLSYDSAYIASVGRHDPLVKIWRRLNYGSADVCFDFVYLQHPQPITNLQWRRPSHVGQTIDNALYTFCADRMLRVWTHCDIHEPQYFQLWGKIELNRATGNPNSSTAASPGLRWAFIIHGGDLAAAAETAVLKSTNSEQDRTALEHLVSIANTSPEICVAWDARGQMSAWALENVGARLRQASDIFDVTHVFCKDMDFLQNIPEDEVPRVEIYTFSTAPNGHLNILLHYFDGKIELYESNVARLFDPNDRLNRLSLKCIWSGHSGSITKIVRNFSGRAIVSRTPQGQSVVWRHKLDSDGSPLSRQSHIPEEGHIHRMSLLRKGRFIVFLGHDTISVWDCRHINPTRLVMCRYTVPGKPLCLLNLPRPASDPSMAYLATITSEKMGIVWKVVLPAYSSTEANLTASKNHRPSIEEFCRFELTDAGELAYVLPVDPAGSAPIVSGFLDVFARDVAISYTHAGRLEFWTARVNEEEGSVEWLSTCSMETGVNEPALVSGSTMKKAALVNSDRTKVSIWDIRGARLEYAQSHESQNIIQDLDWTSTPDSQSILAVGFPAKVMLLSQMRFDYLNEGPAWAAIREINIRDLTPHPIGDSTWLGDGHLVIGAGNQLFVYDRRFDVSGSLVTSLQLPPRKDGMWDMFEVVQRLNGPLPVFHPQFLSQCMLAGKGGLVRRILMELYKSLKFWVEGDTIDDYLGLDMGEFYQDTSLSSSVSGKVPTAYLTRRMSFTNDDEVFTEEVAHSIYEKLTKVAIPQLSGHEQIQLADIVECAGVVEKQRRSMDENGARFMLFFRQHALRKGRTNEIHMSWREISWAYHSTCQDILVDFVSRQHHGTLLWEDARESGMFMWLTDTAAVRAQFELVARSEYTKSEMKNPVDCSLFYLALRKKAVLQGLWRMATWNREQTATQRLLANNFDDPKWKTAALKNAYALMSKRRFEYAAAFFLLGDHLADAVNVCLKQMKDLQLAVAIARVYEGDNGQVLKKLLEDEVLSIAAQEGNRWLASWAFWMLRRRDMAVRALITPVYSLLETPRSPDMQSKLFLTDDPALVVLYAQLRSKTLQTLRGASKVTPRVEWEFVLHSARLYDRMGCDLLGLDLVRNWEFLLPTPGTLPGLGGEIDPLKLLKRRSSLVVADLPMSPVTPRAPMGMRTGGGRPQQQQQRQQQQAPTTFVEPDSNSLLDSFGF